MIQYIIAAGIGAFLGSQSKKSKKSYAHGGGVNDVDFQEWKKDTISNRAKILGRVAEMRQAEGGVKYYKGIGYDVSEIEEALNKAMKTNPNKVFIVYKAMHDCKELFSHLAYNQKIQSQTVNSENVHKLSGETSSFKCSTLCGCTKSPWTGSLNLKSSNLIFEEF